MALWNDQTFVSYRTIVVCKANFLENSGIKPFKDITLGFGRFFVLLHFLYCYSTYNFFHYYYICNLHILLLLCIIMLVLLIFETGILYYSEVN